MRRERWLLVGGGVVVVVVLGALLWQPPAAPLPAPAPSVEATATGTRASTPVPLSTATPAITPPPTATLPPLTPVGPGPIALSDGVVITLTTGWQGALYPASAALGFTDANGLPLLAAWQGGADYLAAPVRMTLIRVPRAGISLPAYLDGLAAALSTTPDVVITGQQITTTLRSDGLPAGAVSYTDNLNSLPQYGRQAALIDDSGEHLLLLTLTAMADQAVVDELFRAAVASITFGK